MRWDAFADRIRKVWTCAKEPAAPVMTTLSAIGAGMERRNEISLIPDGTRRKHWHDLQSNTCPAGTQ
ncbi:hypothetical protein QM138_23885 [Enterobacter hormaechei]|uniref:hypothetical protein n=1 Tax=Enterobacter hormaechei TaxID=158836 RepID=UPI00294A4221|nr:hypothetical protein [Enterobacter hormaechei]MDV5712705.1 hypothetical protein [Enterobacter hormaechei]